MALDPNPTRWATCPKCGRMVEVPAAAIKAKCTNPECGAVVKQGDARTIEGMRRGPR